MVDMTRVLTKRRRWDGKIMAVGLCLAEIVAGLPNGLREMAGIF
jgi:hypothetical protein